MNKLLYRVPEVAEMLGLGKTKTYSLVGRGVIRSVRIDAAVRVPGSAIQEFVDRLESVDQPEPRTAA